MILYTSWGPYSELMSMLYFSEEQWGVINQNDLVAHNTFPKE
jgi:hypothetical protein